MHYAGTVCFSLFLTTLPFSVSGNQTLIINISLLFSTSSSLYPQSSLSFLTLLCLYSSRSLTEQCTPFLFRWSQTVKPAPFIHSHFKIKKKPWSACSNSILQTTRPIQFLHFPFLKRWIHIHKHTTPVNMRQFSYALLASLLPAVLAIPRKAPHGTAPAPFPSGIVTPYDAKNATEAPIRTDNAGEDTRTTIRRTRIATRTLLIPDASSSPSPLSNTESPLETDVPVVSPVIKHVLTMTPESSFCGPTTVTVTSDNVVTVTVTAGQSVTPEAVSKASKSVIITEDPPTELPSSTVVVVVPTSKPKTFAVVSRGTTPTTTLKVTVVPSVTPEAETEASPSVTPEPVASPSVTSDTGSLLPITSNPPVVGSPKAGIVGKRGLLVTGDHMDATVDAFANAEKVTWMLNWYSGPPKTLPSRIEFVPENYGKQSDLDGEWTRNAKKAIEKGATHFIGFGETHTDNAKLFMTPNDAVTLWLEKLQPYTNKVKVSAPSTLQTGHDWLQEFLDKCEARGCDVGFLAIHWFWKCTEYKDFQSNVEKGIAMAKGKPVWIDNFQCTGSEEEQTDFLSKAVPYLESLDGIERYAYVPTDGQPFLASDGKSVSKLGQHYANL